MKDGHLRILLAGNPNSGKTTIFNELSGMRAKVGNYAGVTVERKTGSFSAGGREIEVRTFRGSIPCPPRQRKRKSPPTPYPRATSI